MKDDDPTYVPRGCSLRASQEYKMLLIWNVPLQNCIRDIGYCNPIGCQVPTVKLLCLLWSKWYSYPEGSESITSSKGETCLTSWGSSHSLFFTCWECRQLHLQKVFGPNCCSLSLGRRRVVNMKENKDCQRNGVKRRKARNVI